MLPCPDSSSYFSMERFYFYWKATMNLSFPWETISMLFASRAPKTREKDNKLTQELSHLVKTPSVSETLMEIWWKDTGRSGGLFQFRHEWLPVPTPASLTQVQKGMTSASGSGQPVQVRASKSNVFPSFHEHRETIICCGSDEKYANCWCFPNICVKINL